MQTDKSEQGSNERKEDVWSGKFIDANGRSGAIEVKLSAGGKRASWALTMPERGREPMVIRGETDVAFDERGMRMVAQQEFSQGKKLEWEIDVKPAAPGRYAKEAMVGRYEVRAPEEVEGLPLTTGVLVLWKFS